MRGFLKTHAAILTFPGEDEWPRLQDEDTFEITWRNPAWVVLPFTAVDEQETSEVLFVVYGTDVRQAWDAYTEAYYAGRDSFEDKEQCDKTLRKLQAALEDKYDVKLVCQFDK